MYTQSLSTYKMMIKINDDKDDKNICIPTEEKKKKYLLNVFQAELVPCRNVNVIIQSKMCLIFTFKLILNLKQHIYMNI